MPNIVCRCLRGKIYTYSRVDYCAVWRRPIDIRPQAHTVANAGRLKCVRIKLATGNKGKSTTFYFLPTHHQVESSRVDDFSSEINEKLTFSHSIIITAHWACAWAMRNAHYARQFKLQFNKWIINFRYRHHRANVECWTLPKRTTLTFRSNIDPWNTKDATR